MPSTPFSHYALLTLSRSKHEASRSEPHSDTETAKHITIIEPQTKSNEILSELSTRGDTKELCSQGNLTPLQRYCFNVQAHEQLAVGQTPDRKSLTGPNQLGNMLDKAAKLFGGSSPDISSSSWSILSSSLGEGQKMIPAPKLDDLLLATNSAVSQATPQEQAERLRTM